MYVHNCEQEIPYGIKTKKPRSFHDHYRGTYLILTACAFAEKAHEDHLPERNGQGNAETTVYTGVSAGILILLSVVLSSLGNRNRTSNYTGYTTNFGQSNCPVMASHFPSDGRCGGSTSRLGYNLPGAA